MLLALDVGNTETAFGLHDGQGWQGSWRVRTENGGTPDEWAATLDSLLRLDGFSLSQIKEMALASGVPAVTANLVRLGRERIGCRPVQVNAATAGIEVGYKAPQTLGADRIANAVAAFERYGRALVVVDFGTATNFDYVNPKGVFEGGIIAPGLMLTGEALFRRAAQLPQVDVLQEAPKLVAQDTVSAMRAGLHAGYLELIRGLLRGLKAEVETDPLVIATGGLAPVLAPGLEFDAVDPNLTLEGVRIVFERNRT